MTQQAFLLRVLEFRIKHKVHKLQKKGITDKQAIIDSIIPKLKERLGFVRSLEMNGLSIEMIEQMIIKEVDK